jgi:hypothetical protein
MNEKRAATGRLSPLNSPAMIVLPERDTPGNSAVACAAPITSASRSPIDSKPRPARLRP